MRVSVLIAAAYLTSACYNFRPLETPIPDAGAYVAATLSDSGSVELARYLGPDVFVVRGRYLGSGADEHGLAVSVAEVETKRGDEVSWRGETITLPVDAIASLEVRRLDKGRSYLVAGVGAAGLIATTLAFSLTGSGTQPNPGSGRPPKQ